VKSFPQRTINRRFFAKHPRTMVHGDYPLTGLSRA
jgi:hypothetical protein